MSENKFQNPEKITSPLSQISIQWIFLIVQQDWYIFILTKILI